MVRFAFALSFCLLLSCFALSQIDPAAGILPFSTQGIGGVDLATSNVSVSAPIRNKAGKIPFSYGLMGNFHSYIWKSGSSSQWFTNAYFVPQPAQSFGWGALSSNCPGQNSQLWNLYVTDATGAQHPVPGAISCSGQRNLLSTATDGSGYTLSITGTYQSESVIVYDKAGNVVNLAQAGGTTPWSITDPDGATIASSGSSYPITYTDSLGQVALTVGSNNTYTYTDAGGSNQSYTVSYTTYNFVTNFGCSGITDSNYSGFWTLPTSITTPTGAKYTIAYEQTPGYGSGNTTGRIASITYPSGGSVSYSYSDPSGHNGINCISGVVPTLKVTVNDHNGNSGTWKYVNGNNSATAGNFTVTETDPAGNQTVYSFAGEYQTQAVYYQGTSTALKTMTTCYGVSGSTPPSRTNCPAPSLTPSSPITETDVYTSLGTSSYNEVQTKFDAIYGNVTYTAAYDFGASTPTTQVLNVYGQSYSSPTACTAYPSGTYINNTPCYSHTQNSAGTDVAKTKIAYGNTGHPTSTSRWVSGSTWLTSTASFNPNGTMATATDAAGNEFQFWYTGNGQCNGLLETAKTYPGSILGGDSQEWDCNGGVVTSQTDLNGNTTTYTYNDPLYRLTQIQQPQNTNPTGGTTKGITYSTGNTFPWTVTTTTIIDSIHTATTTNFLDGLGRTYAVYRNDPDSSNSWDHVWTTYNALGQVASITNPYYLASDPTYGLTSYSYDALSRVIQVTNPDNTYKTVSYNLRATEVVDEVSSKKIYQNDGLGRLQYACEVTSATQVNGASPAACNLDITGTGFLTTHAYDPQGNLSSTAQSTAPTRAFSYDGLSRLIQEVNPESGTTTYAYDTQSPGDLYTRTRPLQNGGSGTAVTTYTHDLLHRLTAISYADGGVTPSVSYTYDLPSQGGVTLQPLSCAAHPPAQGA